VQEPTSSAECAPQPQQRCISGLFHSPISELSPAFRVKAVKVAHVVKVVLLCHMHENAAPLKRSAHLLRLSPRKTRPPCNQVRDQLSSFEDIIIPVCEDNVR
jgi:hypothetical protein